MQIFLRILKEIGIGLVFLLLILGLLALAFYEKVPFGKEIPQSIKYTSIERDEYNVRGDVEDKANATQTFGTSSAQLEEYLTEKIVSPGRIEPFRPVVSVPDVPTEVVNTVYKNGYAIMTTTDEKGNTVTTTVSPDGSVSTVVTSKDGTVVSAPSSNKAESTLE